MKPGPSVVVIAVLYIFVGSGGFVIHLPSHWQGEDILIEATELLAVICGVFLLFGKKWARWLALAWMALHVIISKEVRIPVWTKEADHKLTSHPEAPLM